MRNRSSVKSSPRGEAVATSHVPALEPDLLADIATALRAKLGVANPTQGARELLRGGSERPELSLAGTCASQV